MPDYQNLGEPPPPTDRENEDIKARTEQEQALMMELEELGRKSQKTIEEKIIAPLADELIKAKAEVERLRLLLFSFEMWATCRPPFPANSLTKQNAIEKWINEMPECQKAGGK